MAQTLKALQKALASFLLDGFLLPSNDEFMGEYIPASARRLEWLTGFTGSAGFAVLLGGKAAFFTDGRYTLQAQAEVQGMEQHNNGATTPEAWLAARAQAGARIGYDPMLHTQAGLTRFTRACPDVTFVPVSPNPVDGLWQGRPAAPGETARLHPVQLAGRTAAEKRAELTKELSRLGVDAMVLTAPDSLAWLLNMRGSDVPFTPFVLAYALLWQGGGLRLYLDPARVPEGAEAHMGGDIVFCPPASLADDLKTLAAKRVLIDPQSAPVWFHQTLLLLGGVPVEATDPCQRVKACKTHAEQEGMRSAHLRDGLALTRFLAWLATSPKEGPTEMDVAEKLLTFRAQDNLFLEPSFATIAGSGPNGAIVHYHATEASNRVLDRDSLLLVDSGGQYADGTTDVTRTVALGTPSQEMRDRFTRVLKGHIALARAVFPEGTTGGQLDALARMPLWQEGLDYDHGTGHGVGSYLSVHEGPQRIGKRGGDAVIAPGMVISNEPGYYKMGEYGIRIESLVLVARAPSLSTERAFYAFETLTLAPIDRALVVTELLNKDERNWLNAYHASVRQAHFARLDAAAAAWLEAATAPI